MLPELRLKIKVRGRHPWFYRKMVRRPEESIPAGSAVRVVDSGGRFVGTGFYNPQTDLALRMLARAEVDDPQRYLLELLDAAIELRERTLDLPRSTTGYRLAHGEGDGFPGLILDRLGDVVVAQLFSLCMQQRIEAVGERLLERTPGLRLCMTVDATARKREGMSAVPPVRGIASTVVEHGIEFDVTCGAGHKTGFFADQRDNRQLVRRRAADRRVLDLCCNSGGFALNAARGGAREVVAIDLDEAAVEQTRANARRNGLQLEVDHADAFDVLRDVPAGRFDLIVLDPPKWAAGASEVDAAARRYRDANRLALERLDDGGELVTCSCSGALSEARFLACVREAAVDARRDVRILAARGAGPDHPVALECPQTHYLKALWLEVRR